MSPTSASAPFAVGAGGPASARSGKEPSTGLAVHAASVAAHGLAAPGAALVRPRASRRVKGVLDLGERVCRRAVGDSAAAGLPDHGIEAPAVRVRAAAPGRTGHRVPKLLLDVLAGARRRRVARRALALDIGLDFGRGLGLGLDVRVAPLGRRAAATAEHDRRGEDRNGELPHGAPTFGFGRGIDDRGAPRAKRGWKSSGPTAPRPRASCRRPRPPSFQSHRRARLGRFDGERLVQGESRSRTRRSRRGTRR